MAAATPISLPSCSKRRPAFPPRRRCRSAIRASRVGGALEFVDLHRDPLFRLGPPFSKTRRTREQPRCTLAHVHSLSNAILSAEAGSDGGKEGTPTTGRAASWGRRQRSCGACVFWSMRRRCHPAEHRSPARTCRRRTNTYRRWTRAERLVRAIPGQWNSSAFDKPQHRRAEKWWACEFLHQPAFPRNVNSLRDTS
jgi:hypothetical protein